MASLQFNLIRLIFKLYRRVQPIPPQVDVLKERSELDTLSRLFGSSIVVQRSVVDIDGMQAEWLYPADNSTPGVVLYLHGGGYIAGSINTHRSLVAEIVAASGLRGLIIDYRLAPEHPFPASIEDASNAYHWLMGSGVQPESIAIAGDSSGGGQTLATLVKLRDEGTPLPGCAVCLSPWINLTNCGDSWQVNAKLDLMIEHANLCNCAELYLHGADPRMPLASPLFADLHGLPPIYIQVGSDEVLLSDATEFSKLAEAAGVEMRLEVWEGMQHLWQMVTRYAPESRQAVKKIGDYLQEKIIVPKQRAGIL